ncbi:unnamed protein product [Schistocephalus solidus]|uniref:C2H2-type domain-containing protein n=1 Tax=Schistocephalus solidus TaxID=70667 RepID=A0A183TQJ8_SCHSO|nr:unnamed protein product [Schistocephalus solidus]
MKNPPGLEKKTYKCEICQTEFKCKQSLHDHVAFVHEGSLNLRCEICQAVFTLKHCLKRHIATIHESECAALILYLHNHF